MTLSHKNNFDLLRLFAAFQVFIYHLFTHFPQNGFIESSFLYLNQLPGVPIFFFISGYLIFGSFEKNKDNISNYFKNRFYRIFPALWVYVALFVLYFIISNQFSIFDYDLWKWIVAQSTFAQQYTPSSLRDWGIGTPNGSLWSISVELQFYFFVPFFFYLISAIEKLWVKNLMILIIFIFIISFNKELIFDPEAFYAHKISENWTHTELLINKIYKTSIFFSLPYFLIGIFFFLNKETIIYLVKDKWYIYLIAYTIYFLVVALGFEKYYVPGFTNFYSVIGVTLLALMIFSMAYSYNNISFKILKGNDISYGMYIFHMPIINIFLTHFQINLSIHIPLVILIVITLAILSWKFIEKPSLKFKNA